MSSDTLPIFAKASTSASLTFGQLSTAAATMPVRIADQDRAHLARALRWRTSSFRARSCWPGAAETSAAFSSSVAFEAEAALVGVDQRLFGVRRRRRRRLDAALEEEFAQLGRRVGPRDEVGDRLRPAAAAASLPRSRGLRSRCRVVSTIRMPSCSRGRGAIAPCAASMRTSRATSPRRKKSSIGVLRPAAISIEPGNPGSRRGRCGPTGRRPARRAGARPGR